MVGNLGTTNLLLGIMAVVSVLEAVVLIGAGVAIFMVYRRVMELVEGLEARQIAPAMVRVHAILDDLKEVSAKVREETERVDHAIRTTMDRVDDTADRVRSNVRATTSRVVGFVRGLRTAIISMLHSRPQPMEGMEGRS
jgi:vacuolar-type H+-ATPase subunit I/STV1